MTKAILFAVLMVGACGGNDELVQCAAEWSAEYSAPVVLSGSCSSDCQAPTAPSSATCKVAATGIDGQPTTADCSLLGRVVESGGETFCCMLDDDDRDNRLDIVRAECE